MGFLILGIGSISETRLIRAILQIISHGFIGAALFFLAGTSYDRLRLLYLDEMGGMAIPMPKMFTIFTTLSMASLALPGMSGFVAEFNVLLGIITNQKYLFITKILITFVTAIGMILTLIIYYLSYVKCFMDTSFLINKILIFLIRGHENYLFQFLSLYP